jgi:hypothetical protein
MNLSSSDFRKCVLFEMFLLIHRNRTNNDYGSSHP